MTNPVPDQTRAKTRFPARFVRYFFVGMAVLFLLWAAIGFTPSYQGVSSGSLKFHWFAHLHGLIMTSWLVLFLVQNLLVAGNKLQSHRRLGQVGFGLGIVVWLVMGTASVRGRIELGPPLEDSTWDTLFIELYAMNLFALFLGWGMAVRRKAAAHKRLVFLATMVLLQAAVDRTRWLPFMTIGVNFIYLDLLLIPLFIYDWLLLTRIHRTTLIGTAILLVTQLTVLMAWGAPAWHQFWYNRFAPYMNKPMEVKLTEVQRHRLVGNYGDTAWHLTVSQQDNKLFLQLPELPKWELGATSDSTLFVRTMVWKLTFTKGADGQVSQLTNNQGPLEWKVAKMK